MDNHVSVMEKTGVKDQNDDPRKLSIRGRLRFLAKDSVLYGGAAMLSKAFGLITFPLLTRYFSVEDYGLINYFLVFSTLLGVLFVFGQDSAVARYFYEYRDTSTRRQVIAQSLAFQLVCVAALFPFLWTGSSWLAAYMHQAPQAEAIFRLVLLQIPFAVLGNFSRNLLKWTFSRARFLILTLGSIGVNLVLIAAAILVFRIGVEGVFLVMLVNRMVFAALVVFFVRRWLSFPREACFVKRLLAFAAPYGVIGLLGAFVPLMQRAAVEQLLGSHELGLYTAGATVAALVTMAASAFQTAWGPFCLAIHQEPDAGITYNWVLKAFTAAFCCGVLLLSAVAGPLIVILASDRYAVAAIVVFPLAMGLAAQAMSWVTEIGIGISKKTYLSLVGYGAFVIVSLIAMLALGSLYGMYGVGLGAMLGYFVKGTVLSVLAQRVYRLPWSYGPVLIMVGLTTAVGVWVAAAIGMAVGYGLFAIAAMATFLTLFIFTVMWIIEDRLKKIRMLRKEDSTGYTGEGEEAQGTS
jgi:O-antigen/teichoic acid export membrane protein